MAPTTVPTLPLQAVERPAFEVIRGRAHDGVDPDADRREPARTSSTRQEVLMATVLAACPIIGVTGSHRP
jgi:hypothetical protein